MLEIIKQGEIRKPSIREFKCNSCGCIFKTDVYEYDNVFSPQMCKLATRYHCSCPTCGIRSLEKRFT